MEFTHRKYTVVYSSDEGKIWSEPLYTYELIILLILARLFKKTKILEVKGCLDFYEDNEKSISDINI